MLRQILQEFLSLKIVTAAALVSRDGFVVDIASLVPMDIDALGALGSSLMTYFERGTALLKIGGLRRVILEYQGGAMILSPMTKEEFLVILTDTTKELGSLTFKITGATSRIAAVM